MRIIKKILSYMMYSKFRIRAKVNLLIRMKQRKKCKIVRLIIQEQLRKKYHIVIAENAVIGSILLPHPHNVVIGRGVHIGDNCTLYHDVTLGQNQGMFPCICDNVIVYAGAKIIGKVTVGNNAIIGANAVVTSDVPENAIVAGIPGRIIRYRTEQDVFC